MSLFPMNAREMRVRLMQVGAAGLAAAMIAGCGSTYRATVTSTSPSGPAAQPSSLAVVVSSPSTSSAGIATIVDYSGDTVMATASIGPGPHSFTLDGTGSTAYTVNSDGTLTNFPVSTSLQQKNVTYSTLPTTAEPVGMFSPSSGLWVADLTGNAVDVLTGSPETFKIAIPVAPTPIAVGGQVTSGTGARFYSISLNNSSTATADVIPYNDMTCNTAPSTVTQNGEADAIEVSSYSVSAQIPLGKCPVYSVIGSDNKRLFVLNRGSDTITVINTQTDALNTCTPFLSQSGQTVTCHPTLPLSSTAVTATGITPTNGVAAANLPTTAGPVYAEYNAATQQLVVADYDGGTVSIIDVSLDIYGNDSSTFGTTFTVKVGNTATPYPAAVTALYTGDRAYTANQGDDAGGTGNGTVSIVNLTSHTLEKTLSVVGHPRTVVSTSNSLYGKVYMASPDSTYVTVIGTKADTVDTTVLVQGNVIDVRTSTQNAVSGNAIDTSRRPGAGQPCYLPGAAAEASIDTCQAQ
jgi:DNA-binding beta-propeller fold protein YncE